MTTKEKLKYGFHYTWKEILPKSEIVVVYATDLEEARTIVRAKVAELYPDTSPTCHWITMPKDYERLSAETAQIRQPHISRTSIKMVLLSLIILAIMVLLTSCDTTRFIQCNKNFRKKVENLNQRLTGAQYYRLEAISPEKVNEK